VKSLTKKIVRNASPRRCSHRWSQFNRDSTAVREIDLFPMTHGSALFQRGETQVVNVTTLACANEAADRLDHPDEFRRYMHHYNFRLLGRRNRSRRRPKRREVGHGMLAERALVPVLPASRSSPTRCAWCLTCCSPTDRRRWRRSAVPPCRSWRRRTIKAPVAGIAMDSCTKTRLLDAYRHPRSRGRLR